MKLSQVAKLLVMTTVLSLIYINMQMKIIDLAYQGKQKERSIRQLSENNANYTYNILKIKSSHNLGYRMLDENSDMKFIDVKSVVSLEEAPEEKTEITLLTKPAKKPNVLMSFFSLRKAEAGIRPQE